MSEEQALLPQRPYLLRALYEWLVDNELTPQLLVNAELPGVRVPRQYVQEGKIVLNIAPHSVGGLQMANDEVRFNARFGGVSQTVVLPVFAIEAIYARENSVGTLFSAEPAYENEMVYSADGQEQGVLSEEVTKQDDSTDDLPPDSPPKGRPHLKVIK